MFNIVNDKALLISIKNNSETAFKVVYDEYFLQLKKFIFKMSRDSNLAEEIVQTTLVKVWEKRDHIELSISLKAYLYKMSYHEYLQHIPKKSRFPEVENTVIEAIEELEDEDDNQILIEKIRQEIAKLPPKCRQVFEMSKCRA